MSKKLNRLNSRFICIHPFSNLIYIVANPRQLPDQFGIGRRVVAAGAALTWRGDAGSLVSIDGSAHEVGHRQASAICPLPPLFRYRFR